MFANGLKSSWQQQWEKLQFSKSQTRDFAIILAEFEALNVQSVGDIMKNWCLLRTSGVEQWSVCWRQVKKKKKGSRRWIKALLNRVAWHFIEGIEGRQEDFLYCFLNLKLSLGSKVSYSSCRFKSNKNLNSPFWKTTFNFLI